MTTDITELAQGLKAAAEKAGIEQWVNNRGEVNTADYEVDGGVYIDHICNCEIVGTESPQAEFIAMANPANILALVEALEYYKSREERVTSLVRDNSKSWDELYRQVEAKGKRNVELVEALESEKRICATWRKTAESNGEKLEKAQTINAAAEKLVRCKGRYHSEQNYRALAALFGVNTPDLPPLEHENVHYAYAAEMEIAALRQRIAELESHAFTVEPFRSFVTDADLAALHRFAECCDDPESGGHDLEKEQVRRLEEIGALRRHGRVHWITDFGDVLISITAGMKVGGE